MSQNPVYTTDLVSSSDMSSLESLEDFSSWTFSPLFNKPGSLSITIPLDCAAAYLAKKHATGVLITRNGRVIWSGSVDTVVKSGEANTCEITANGWLNQYNRRYVRLAEQSTLSFGSPGTVGGLIYKALINECNAQQDTSGITRPLKMTFGTAYDTQARIRSYKVGDNYGSSLTELIEIEDGCDIKIDHLNRVVSTYDPALSYAIRTGVTFDYNTGSGNLADCVETDDGSTTANRENAVAANGNVFSADDPVAINDAGVMLEEWLSLSDISDPTIVSAYANAELVYKAYGIANFTLIPKQFGDMIRPYDDFEWGDLGYLSSEKGSLSIAGMGVRLFGGTITRDQSGNEIVQSLTVVNS